MDKNRDPSSRMLDEVWDAEKALRQKQSDSRAFPMPPTTPAAPSTPRPRRTQPTGRHSAQPAGKRRTQSAGKRRAKPALSPQAFRLAAVLLAVLVIVVILIVCLSGGSQTDTPPETEVFGPTYPLVYVADRLVQQADRLAAGYDYDAAIALLLTFGDGWQEQEAIVQAKADYESARDALLRWEDTTTIPHIYVQSLIVDPARAFDGDSNADSYNQDHLTVTEFQSMLQALYDNGYVLVSQHDLAQAGVNEAGETVYVQGDIYLPPGKKPLILSQDDVNYYAYMVDGDADGTPDAQGDGFACQLVLTDTGIASRYISAEGETLCGDYDVVPVLERFIESHPDFSYRGARGVLAVTGYEGVLGYRTTAADREALSADAYAEEVRQATAVADWLRENGWEFASHSYNHAAYGYNDVNTILADLERWESEVAPIVGETDLLYYPFGIDIAGEEAYSGSKYDAMYAKGFRYFCGTDSDRYWAQIRDSYVRQNRRAINGYYLYWWPELLDDLFDATAILDPARPEVPKKNG